MRRRSCQYCFETFDRTPSFRSLFGRKPPEIKCGACLTPNYFKAVKNLGYWIVYCLAALIAIIIFVLPLPILVVMVIWLDFIPDVIGAIIVMVLFVLAYLLGARIRGGLLNLWCWHYGDLTLGKVSVVTESFG